MAEEKEKTPLRRRAEELLATGRPRLGEVDRGDLESLVHELQVSHIELELQNDEIQRARHQLEASRNRYQELYDLAPVGYLRLDPAGQVLESNLTAGMLLGRSRSELQGERLDAFVLGVDRERYLRHRQDVLMGDVKATCEVRLHRGDGSALWVRLITQTARDDAGTRELWVTMSDISRLKRAEEELRTINATLEERVAERTTEVRMQAQMLRALANEITHLELRERRQIAELVHDTLKQELAGARMLLGGLRRHLEGEDAAAALAEVERVLVDSIRTCRTLTDELCPPVLRGAGLVAALEYLAARFQEKRGLQVRVAAETRLEPRSEQVSALLYRSVNELLHNVSKYAGVPDATVTVRSSRSGWMEVEVKDRGDGFDTSTLDHPTDTGFGLFAVRERLEMLGGSFVIDSGPGRGTTVTLAVPVSASEARPVDPSRSAFLGDEPSVAEDAAEVAGGRLRVLVADDHRVMREGLVNLLGRDAGVAVVGAAEDGLEAVTMARELGPHVVLMDVSMPNMDGIEATRRILDEVPGVRVIALSMHDDPGTRKRMRRAGAERYIAKDSPSSEILAAIRGEARDEEPGNGAEPTTASS